MTRAYVLDATTRDILGLLEQSWEELSYTRRYYGMDTFQMGIRRERLYASEIENGRLLYLPDEGDRLFRIEQIQSVAEGSTDNDKMIVFGRSMEGAAMQDRIVDPSPSQYDKQSAVAAETAIKHYVTDHAGSGAAAARQISGLNVVASAAAGATVSVSGRYQTVFDICKQIGHLAEMGWEITYNAGTDQFDFDVIVGTDRSASVFFDFEFETLERWEEVESTIDARTVAIVGGQGEGTGRDIEIRWDGTEPTGFDRREAFIDARDVEVGEATELQERGDAYLAQVKPVVALEATLHQYGSFRYLDDWDMGDIILVRNQERGISYSARVVEVIVSFKESIVAPEIVAVIDRNIPTIQDRINASSAPGTGMVDFARGGVMNVTLVPDLDSQTEGGTVDIGSTVKRFEDIHGEDLDLWEYSNTDISQPTVDFRRARDAAPGEAIVADNDNLGAIRGYAWDGVGWIRGGANTFRVSGTPAANDVPTELVFSLNPGASTDTEVVIMESDGNIRPVTHQGPSMGTFTKQWNTFYSLYHEMTSVSDSVEAAIYINRARAGTLIVNNGEGLGPITWRGYDGDQYLEGAQIRGRIDGTPANNVMPTGLDFYINTGGTATTRKWRIRADGTWEPETDDNVDAGSTTKRIRDIFTGTVDADEPSKLIHVTDVQEFTTSGTWTKPTGGHYTWAKIECVGAGGGGGSGARDSNGTPRGGGSGGGGGGHSVRDILISKLAATETVTIGTGGAGAAGIAAAGDGNGGTGGAETWLGQSLVAAFCAAAGGGGGAGGERHSSGNSELSRGGAATYPGGGGGAGNDFGGQNAGRMTIDSQGASLATYINQAGGAGGGGGGGGRASSDAEAIGGDGGDPGWNGAGGAGGDGATNGSGTAGVNGTSYTTAGERMPGGGGGGGAGNTGNDGSSAGGDGGSYGGGGGGGGGQNNSGTSGVGGDGADGFVRVTCW